MTLSTLTRKGAGGFGTWSYTVPPGAKYAIVESYSKIYKAWRDRDITWYYSGNGSKSWTHYLDGSFGNNPSKSSSEKVTLDGGTKWSISVTMSGGAGKMNTKGEVSGKVTFYYK